MSRLSFHISGLPGHWVVIQLDGKKTIRVGKSVLDSQTMKKGDYSTTTTTEEAEENGEENAEETENADGGDGEEAAPKEKEPTLKDILLESYSLMLVDGGDSYEYGVESMNIPVAWQFDPHTQETVKTT